MHDHVFPAAAASSGVRGAAGKEISEEGDMKTGCDDEKRAYGRR